MLEDGTGYIHTSRMSYPIPTVIRLA
jgi:hypothetical protein